MISRRGFFKRIGGFAAIVGIAPKTLLAPIEPDVAAFGRFVTLKSMAEVEAMYRPSYLGTIAIMKQFLADLFGDWFTIAENMKTYSIDIEIPNYVQPRTIVFIRECLDCWRPLGVLMNIELRDFGPGMYKDQLFQTIQFKENL